ncbi:response regulator receiver sensor signal transduction histidine kinase [Clostridium aceticum]|uniref:Stage 0 sporulation protein A homolog n=1 Tax=Clostridium aceticum TaxID=84022 RepID=A0A0D8I8B6_9CLOT|nr:ATP-binding protein [Clostridium aceticum]AKL97296.1 response regulator receiver sensor signal transduction histidine kinase [Clostridium aceticum]KJF26314.1 histidine kinase [Clostridium aceticum]
MSKKSIIIILITMLLITFSVIRVADDLVSVNKASQAKLGVLDLSNHDFTQSGPIGLNGEWQFVPGKLVDSDYFSAGFEAMYVVVPSLWTKHKVNDEFIPQFTSGTYRLLVKVSANEEILGIKTTNIRMSNVIYVNGRKIGESGVPKENSSYSPHNTPYISFFYNDEDLIEIIVHVANFNYATGGGIVGSIYLGDEGDILALRQRSLTFDWITIAAFFMAGMYFLGFHIHFRKDTSLLYFSLFCFSVALYSATHNEKILHYMYPQIPYAIFQRLQSASNLVALSLVAYFHRTLKEFSNIKAVKFIIVLGIVVALTTLLPIKINSKLESLYTAYFMLAIIYIIYLQIKAINKGTTGAVHLLISSLGLSIYALVSALNITGKIKLHILPPVFPFFYLMMLSLYMANRFTDTYQKNEELTQQLLQVDRFKDDFLAKTSHEFRTPLYAIIGILQTILNNSTPSTLVSQQEEKIKLVIQKSKRLSSLVQDVLDLAKLKRKELELDFKPVDLYVTTFVIVEVFQYIIKKDIKIINEISKGTPLVHADENRLRQILYNLIDNAIKYTEKGEVRISAILKDDKMIIAVKDTGIGIKKDKLTTIFKEYEQAGDSHQEIHGVGLGLSITKQLVELQGGAVWVKSELGKGTTFSFSLPVIKGEALKGSSISRFKYNNTEYHTKYTFPFVLGNPKNKKIIIADDNHSSLRILMEALESEEYCIIAVDNGYDVLDQLNRYIDINLVLLDIMMPGLTGYEVCQKIRENYSLTELPVLMLTAAILPEDMVAAFQSGANDFLHKPIDITELKIRLNNLISVKEVAQTATNMEIAFLQAQIKPHFIYNVLNSVMSLSYIDIEKTRELLLDFASFLRSSFGFINTHKLVPLQNELSLINSYVQIEKVRYPGKFDFYIEMNLQSDCMIPPLLIQPLVENAIIHGISSRQNGEVRVVINEIGNQAVISVDDNGNGIKKEIVEEIFSGSQDYKGGVGLLNTVKRIKQYSGATISIKSEEGVGTSITMVLPIQSLKEEDEGYAEGHNS